MRKVTLMAAVLLAGCSATSGFMQYEPVVDLKGVDQDKYITDLQTCYGYADKVDPLLVFAQEAGPDILLGAAAGAAIGGIGAHPGTGAALGSAVGGTVGVAEGRKTGRQRQISIINNCLINRGYKILG